MDGAAEVIGQERAAEAIRFGIEIERPGFNVFAMGLPGSGKRTAVLEVLGRHAATQSVPDGWCYVCRFDDPNRPMALRLPPGRATRFKDDVAQLVKQLEDALGAAFDAEEYSLKRSEIEARFDERGREALGDLRRQAASRGLAVITENDRLRLVASDRGEPLTEEEQATLPEKRRRALDVASEELREQLDHTERLGRLEVRAMRDALRELDQRTAEAEVTWRVEEMAQSYADLPPVAEHLGALGRDIVSHLDEFIPAEPPPGAEPDTFRPPTYDAATRYAVNVLVDHLNDDGKPVVEEAHPTVPNLIGRIEYRQAYGLVSTDFTMLRSGALHRANGGYLVLEATDLLQEPHSWESFKRALRTGTIRFEPVSDGPGNVFTELPEPDPIPLVCRIVLLGDVELYQHLYDVDPDFAELFKVKAEFADTMKRDEPGQLAYARFVSKVAREEQLLPFEAGAVAKIVDFGARAAEDASRLTTRLVDVADVLREADYWARKDGAPSVMADHVEHAVAQRIRRADLARDMAQESFLREIVRVPTDGRSVGQVNALTVFDVGDHEFGTPVRITARVHMGGGEVVDIEREVELGGPMHSKGVLILSGYITGRYLPDEPLAMAASLTFEQSGGYIDGDSASLAEVLALLSAVSGLELEQGIAVTGAVNQAGEVQAVGAVNEKIEGFFDLCAARGLNGRQGVVIPADNVQHLMLRADVVEAAAQEKFHVFAVRHVDEGLELMTGLPAGEAGDDGSFPEGTANRAVEDRLRRLAERRKQHADDIDDDADV